MKILLTGSTGFLGSALKEKLEDHHVIEVVSSGTVASSSHVFNKNISGTEDFSDCLDCVDVVIHTAARVHQPSSLQKALKTKFMETNCLGTLNLASQAVKSGVKRFVFISSIKVNGEQSCLNRPFKFDDPRRAESLYGISKAKAEEGLEKLAAATGLEVTIIRPPLVYGPDAKANFATLLKLASRNVPLPLGAVRNKRSFVALDNLIHLIVTCIDHPSAANQIFLVSDDQDISTPKLFSIMVKAFGKKPRLISVNPRLIMHLAKLIGKEDMIDRLCGELRVDIQHTKNVLNWAPVISLVDGVKQCVSALPKK